MDTGEKLVTDHPVPGVPSIDTTEGAKLCWG
jgi:fructose transport system substrate-binding protein